VVPASGVMGALLDRMMIVQGSDDWLFARTVEGLQAELPVATSTVGSIAGLQAVAAGRAHVAACHVELAEVRRQARGPGYVVDLVEREQGLIYDPARAGKLDGLRAASERRLRFVARQPASGTARLVARLVRDEGLAPEWTEVGPVGSHIELALAIRTGQADCGVGICIAAERAGLAFAPLAVERFALAVPAPFFAHARTTRFLEQVIDGLRAACARGLPGYSAAPAGQLSAIGGVA
jgi:molybdate-binding protein